MVYKNTQVFEHIHIREDKNETEPEEFKLHGSVSILSKEKYEYEDKKETWSIKYSIDQVTYEFVFSENQYVTNVGFSKNLQVFREEPAKMIVVDESMAGFFDELFARRTFLSKENTVAYSIPAVRRLIMPYVLIPGWLSRDFSPGMDFDEMVILLCENNVQNFDPEKIRSIVEIVYKSRVNLIFSRVYECFEHHIVEPVKRYDTENEKKLQKILDT